MKTRQHSTISGLLLLVGTLLLGGLAACNTANSNQEPAGVVMKHLEALQNNDFDTWKLTLWPPEKDSQNFTPSFEKPGDLGVISLSIEKVEAADDEAKRIKEQYSGSALAKSFGWSDEYISENLTAVLARYTVDYDNSKVPYNEGSLTQYFYLIRDSADSGWLIWQAASPSN